MWLVLKFSSENTPTNWQTGPLGAANFIQIRKIRTDTWSEPTSCNNEIYKKSLMRFLRIQAMLLTKVSLPSFLSLIKQKRVYDRLY